MFETKAPLFAHGLITVIKSACSLGHFFIFHYSAVYEYEVFLLLTSSKKTSPGPDKLPYWFFRYAAAELTPVITHLIRLTLSNGTPPKAWKHAVVTPVPKVTYPQNLSDLRPISVTPILSRLVEKLIARKYLTPALPTKLLECQYAYRPNRLHNSWPGWHYPSHHFNTWK